MICVSDAARIPLADQSVDLVVGSPPYLDARTYGIAADRKIHEWVAWMLEVTREAVRVCRGPVWWVWAGCTRQRCYQPGPEAVAWEWFKAGGHLIYPCVFVRSGIPGSGGTQEFRHDHEYIHGFKNPGPLPYADVKACGHKPKWGPGGEMSNRLTDGQRVNQWGPLGGSGRNGKNGKQNGQDIKPSQQLFTGASQMRRANGVRRFMPGGERSLAGEVQNHSEPAIANPGTVLRANVGGGHLGEVMSHENEAPFPESIPERFVKTYCPVNGIVLDPFSGSGTTAAVCVKTNRRYVAMDLRMSQALLTRKRVNSGLTPELIA